VTRFVDHGARVAAGVGIGVAATVGISFLLVIPIEPVYWYLALPAGLLIGYYANQRSDRAGGPLGRVVANGLFAGVVTGLTFAALLLGVKALFFVADNGYRDESAGGALGCEPGVDCVYQRYLAQGRGPELEAAGVTDSDSFGRLYWEQQVWTAGLLVVLSTAGGLGGAAMYAFTNRRRPDSAASTEPGTA
jgi:hypothetical protein